VVWETRLAKIWTETKTAFQICYLKAYKGRLNKVEVFWVVTPCTVVAG